LETDFQAKCLAYKWWECSLKRGDYSQDKDQNFCSISVRLETKNYFDLSHGLQRERYQYIASTYLDILKERPETKLLTEAQIISALCESFVLSIEEEESAEFDVIITSQAPPRKSLGPIAKYLGNFAEVLVVKNQKIIHINSLDTNKPDKYS
jgi:hypothetical protein